jgi:hypothetical protein
VVSAHRVRGRQSAICCGSAALNIDAHSVRGRRGAIRCGPASLKKAPALTRRHSEEGTDQGSDEESRVCLAFDWPYRP